MSDYDKIKANNKKLLRDKEKIQYELKTLQKTYQDVSLPSFCYCK